MLCSIGKELWDQQGSGVDLTSDILRDRRSYDMFGSQISATYQRQ
jgi:hypothetical protein